MIKYFNPKWYYQGKFSDEQVKRIDDLFSDWIEDDEKFGIPKDWQKLCRVTSSDRKQDLSPLWDEYLEILKPTQDEFLSQIDLKYDAELVCDNIWCNKYVKGDFQEVHNHCHPDYNIAMVYFHRCNGSQFHFFDATWTENRTSGLDLIMNVPGKEVLQLEVEQGDVVLFPTHYPHFVSPNMDDDIRITFAGNFKMRRKHVPMNELLQ